VFGFNVGEFILIGFCVGEFMLIGFWVKEAVDPENDAVEGEVEFKDEDFVLVLADCMVVSDVDTAVSQVSSHDVALSISDDEAVVPERAGINNHSFFLILYY